MSGHDGRPTGAPSLSGGEPSTASSIATPVPDAQIITLRPTIEVFGKYRLLAEMGHGGMADVYLAVAVGPAGFSRLQVIKRLRPSLAEDPELRAMLLDEARLAAQLHHRNIVQTIEVGAVDDRYFIAMELLDGQPYNRVLRRGKTRGAALPLGLTVKVLSEVLAGLHYAHEAKDYSGEPLAVVHRDVSPQNVFITYDGQVKVMDFGIAKAARRAVETQTGVVRGKVAYMAPEQALPRTKNLDRRADVFSVGVMLWEALAGERMWAGAGDPEILLRLSAAGAPPLPQRPSIPAELARICARALMHDRDERYATAADMRADLEAYLQSKGESGSPEVIGRHVADLFAPDRARMQKLVEEQLAELRAAHLDDDPQLSTASAHRLATGDRPSSVTEGTGGSQPMVKSSSGPPSKERGSSGASRMWVIALGLMIAGGVGFAMRGRLLGDPQAGAQAPAPSVAPAGSATDAPSAAPSVTAPAHPTASVAPEGGLIKVRIAATPPGAKITLDGIQVGSNPFEGKMVKDGAMHRLLIEAPGYAPLGRMLTFDGDVDVSVPLVPRDKAPGAAAGTAAPAPAPSATALVLPPLRPR